MTLDDKIDYSVGVLLNVKVGDKVKKGDLLMSLYIGKKEIDLKNEKYDFINIV